MTAGRRTTEKIDFKEEFKRIGYIWMDSSSVSSRTLPGYTFDPSTINTTVLQINEDVNKEDNEEYDTHIHKTSNQSNK